MTTQKPQFEKTTGESNRILTEEVVIINKTARFAAYSPRIHRINMATDQTGFVSISQLLKRLSTLEQARKVSAEEIAAAVALIFTNSLSPVQFGVLLWALHTTNLDHQAEVLAACAKSMRGAAAQIDATELKEVISRRKRPEGTYAGGLVR